MSIPAHALEITRLLAVVTRELADAGVAGLSPDGSFEHSYTAALMIATIVVRAHGERVHGTDHHRLTFDRFGQLVDGRWADIADFMQHCRRRRNTSVYDVAGSVSAKEAKELLEQADRLRAEVIDWLSHDRPNLI